MPSYIFTVCYRYQSHWQGGYTKRLFDERVLPVLVKANAVFLKKIPFTNAPANQYKVTFVDDSDAVAFRKELQAQMRSLHYKFGGILDWNAV